MLPALKYCVFTSPLWAMPVYYFIFLSHPQEPCRLVEALWRFWRAHILLSDNETGKRKMPGTMLSAALKEHFERASSWGACSETCGASMNALACKPNSVGERARMPCVCCHVHVVGCARGIYSPRVKGSLAIRFFFSLYLRNIHEAPGCFCFVFSPTHPVVFSLF